MTTDNPAAALETTFAPGVATVWLNRPDVRNAFDDEVIAELTQTFESLGQRDDLRAIVLAARGKAFCAGANLNWMRRMAGYSREQNLADAGRLARMLQVLSDCPVPTIARIQGDVYAGGMGLVAACDMAVAAEGAGFCLSETRIGLIPATIGPYVVRAMGRRAAQRYLLTAERFDAAEAHRLGLVHTVVAADGLDAAVDGLVQALRAAGPQAVRACKRLLREVCLLYTSDAADE